MTSVSVHTPPHPLCNKRRTMWGDCPPCATHRQHLQVDTLRMFKCAPCAYYFTHPARNNWRRVRVSFRAGWA